LAKLADAPDLGFSFPVIFNSRKTGPVYRKIRVFEGFWLWLKKQKFPPALAQLSHKFSHGMAGEGIDDSIFRQNAPPIYSFRPHHNRFEKPFLMPVEVQAQK
jgi:hypothetical protein